MKTKLKDTDFLCISSRLHSAEKDMIGKDKLLRLIEAKSYDEALRLTLEMYGIQDSADIDYAEILSAELSKAYKFANELISGIIDLDEKPFYLLNPFRYVYDCQNLKVAIKCELLGKTTDGLISENGSVSCDDLKAALTSRDFSHFAPNMSKAASFAIDQLAATGDPQEVDLILDKAAFEDMASIADMCNLEYLKELMCYKADSVNITTALRCIKQGKNKNYLNKLLVSGGKLDNDFFLSNYDETIGKLINALAYTEYNGITKYSEQQSEITPSEAEKLCSMLYLKKAYGAIRIPFGPELIICYIVRKEYEIKNVRIILAGKACGLTAEKIKERLMIEE